MRGPRSATRPLPAGRDGQGQAARWVSAADAHARWACEDEGEAEAEVDVSVKEDEDDEEGEGGAGRR